MHKPGNNYKSSCQCHSLVPIQSEVQLLLINHTNNDNHCLKFAQIDHYLSYD